MIPKESYRKCREKLLEAHDTRPHPCTDGYNGYDTARQLLLLRRLRDTGPSSSSFSSPSPSPPPAAPTPPPHTLTPKLPTQTTSLLLRKSRSNDDTVQTPPSPMPHRVQRLGSPLVRRNPGGPGYLCEDMLQGGLAFRGQSTARCSTITQDMELDSQSDHSTGSSLESDLETAASSTSRPILVSSMNNGRPPCSSPLLEASIFGDVEREDDKAPSNPFPHPTECTIDLALDCRVLYRIGEREGMGPYAGKITALKYCVGVLSLLAAGTESGIVFIVREGKADAPLLGHSAKVMDLVWSEPGSCLLSVSLDKTIRVWRVDSSRPDANECIRSVSEPAVGLCISLAPLNNNIFVVGTVGNTLTFYNISTGKLVRRHKLKRSAGFLAWSPSGRALYLGDAGGRVVACQYDFMTHDLKKSSVVHLEEEYPVTSLCLRRTPEGEDLLLANVMCNVLYLIQTASMPPYTMHVVRRLPIPQRCSILRSVFCPGNRLLFTTGSEDGSLWVVQASIGSEAPPQVLKLQGHQGTVLNVAVNQRGNITSGDEMGCIMIWECRTHTARKRKKRQHSGVSEDPAYDPSWSGTESGSGCDDVCSSSTGTPPGRGRGGSDISESTTTDS